MIKLIDFCIELDSVAMRLYGEFHAAAAGKRHTAFWSGLITEKRERIEQFRTLRGGFEAGLVPSPISDKEMTRTRLKKKLSQLYDLKESILDFSDFKVGAGAALQAEATLIDPDVTRLLKLNEIYGLAKKEDTVRIPAIAGIREFGSALGTALISFAGAVVRLHELEEKLWEQEDRDPVTGASARKVLFQHGRFLVDWSIRYERPVGILLVRLDEFESLVRQFGYGVTDAALAATYNRINAVTRKTDWVIRLGPDGFAVLVLGTPAEGLAILAAKIVQQIQAPAFHFKEHEIPITGSVGLCCSDGLAEPTVELLLHLAKKAQEDAQGMGGNCAVLADGSELS